MAEEIRLSLFLSAGLCGGLPTVIWALYSLRHHQDAGGHVSAFVFSLIVSDVVELLLSPFLNTRLIQHRNSLRLPCLDGSPCWVLHYSFAEARLCGLHFHQLVALEGIVSMIYPCSTPHAVDFFFPLTLSFAVFVYVVICKLFTIGYTINLILCVVPVILAIITSVFTIRISLTCSSDGPLRQKRPGLSVLAVSLFTLLVLYMPCLVLSCVTYPDPFYDSPWATTAVSIMSLRVVTEPLLCVLVCRDILKYQTLETHNRVQ